MKIRQWGSLGAAVILLGGIAFVTPNSTRAQEAEHVVINEMSWAGSTLSAQDEWIELYNPTADPVDISGWVLTKDTGVEDLMVTIASGSIASGGFFIISNFAASGSVMAGEPDLVDTAVTLSNSALLIRLYSGDWTDPANLVDGAGDGGVPPAGNNSAKLSMERAADHSGWQDAGDAVGLDVGVTDKGTPGHPNSVVSFPPEVMSIEPNSVTAGQSLVITAINGGGFEAGIVVKLVLGARTIVATGVEIASPILIDGGIFITPEDAVGVWDLVVTNPNGMSATLPAAVTISEPPPEFDLATTIRINEVYPQPGTTANDEYIELINIGSASVSLEGWQVDDVADGGSTPFTFGPTVITANGFVTIYKPGSHLTLNDSGDTVRLIQPGGLVLDSTSYDASTRGSTWARGSSQFQWTTTPTPNGRNVFTVAVSPEVEDTPTDEREDIPQSFNIGDVVLSELLPKPLEDEEEFIELQNVTQGAINLAGWSLVDGSGKRYRWTNAQLLGAGNRLVIYSSTSKISLNDSGGESVQLLDPTGKRISTLGYPDRAPANSAYILKAAGIGTWVTPPTPGLANPDDLVEVESEVGGWVEGDAIDDVLPVTGWGNRGIWGLTLTTLGILFIMGWQLWQRKFLRK